MLKVSVTIDYHWSPAPHNVYAKVVLENTAEEVAVAMDNQMFREGELNKMVEGHQYTGWWTITREYKD